MHPPSKEDHDDDRDADHRDNRRGMPAPWPALAAMPMSAARAAGVDSVLKSSVASPDMSVAFTPFLPTWSPFMSFVMSFSPLWCLAVDLRVQQKHAPRKRRRLVRGELYPLYNLIDF